MSQEQYRYTFDDDVPMDDVWGDLLVAVCAAEALHGRAQLRMDATFRLDPRARRCTVDASTPVGRTLARVFTELLSREFGERAFTVKLKPEAAPQKASRCCCCCREVA